MQVCHMQQTTVFWSGVCQSEVCGAAGWVARIMQLLCRPITLVIHLEASN